MIPWEFRLLFSQGYDSAAFSAAASMAGMIMGAVRRQLLHGLQVEPAPVQALRMRDSSMFYFNISINRCTGSK
jgi:hypothetical protein